MVPLSRFDTTGQRGCDRRSHLVLNREYVIQLPVIFVCPDMSVIRRVDELNRHAHPVADLADASFHEVLGAKLFGDFAHIHRAILVNEAGIARDDEQLVVARQFRDDVLRQAVGKKFLLGVATHVVEWQHHYGRFRNGALCLYFRQGRTIKPDAIEAHRAANVL